MLLTAEAPKPNSLRLVETKVPREFGQGPCFAKAPDSYVGFWAKVKSLEIVNNWR